MATISSFKANMVGSGARSNQFFVQLNFPNFVTLGAVASVRAQFLCKAASLPAVIVRKDTVYYRGREVHFAGERVFQDWRITILNDTTFGIRNAFEQWSHGMMSFNSTNGRTNANDYQVDMAVHQLDRNGAILKSYTFRDAFPIVLGDIQLSYDQQQGTIEEFVVDFGYNYYESNTSAATLFGASVAINTPVGTFPLPL